MKKILGSMFGVGIIFCAGVSSLRIAGGPSYKGVYKACMPEEQKKRAAIDSWVGSSWVGDKIFNKPFDLRVAINSWVGNKIFENGSFVPFFDASDDLEAICDYKAGFWNRKQKETSKLMCNMNYIAHQYKKEWAAFQKAFPGMAQYHTLNDFAKAKILATEKEFKLAQAGGEETFKTFQDKQKELKKRLLGDVGLLFEKSSPEKEMSAAALLQKLGECSKNKTVCTWEEIAQLPGAVELLGSYWRMLKRGQSHFIMSAYILRAGMHPDQTKGLDSIPGCVKRFGSAIVYEVLQEKYTQSAASFFDSNGVIPLEAGAKITMVNGVLKDPLSDLAARCEQKDWFWRRIGRSLFGWGK